MCASTKYKLDPSKKLNFQFFQFQLYTISGQVEIVKIGITNLIKTYFFHLVTLTRSPGFKAILGSSEQGGLHATLKP